MTTLETEYNVRFLSFLSPFPSDFCNGSFNSLYVEQSRRIPVAISTRGQSSFNSVAPQPLNQIRGKSPSTCGLKKFRFMPGLHEVHVQRYIVCVEHSARAGRSGRENRQMDNLLSIPTLRSLFFRGSHHNYRSPCIQNQFPSAFKRQIHHEHMVVHDERRAGERIILILSGSN